LAIEHAGRGISVNAVSPGAIKTSMNPPEMHEFLAGLQPMRRMGEVHEIVEEVLYLESGLRYRRNPACRRRCLRRQW
jgi:NAD(P)-dependent dehydrogenase (short-subunit alcohol dehydrogenase family)